MPERRTGTYRLTPSGQALLVAKRDLVAQIEARTRTTLTDQASLQPALARFAARVTKLNGQVDRAAVERILDTAAEAIANLEVRHAPR